MSDDEDIRGRVTDRLGQLVWLMDPELEEVRYMGPVYEEVTGRPVVEAGRALDSLDLIHPDDREAFGDWLDDVRADAAAGAADERYSHDFRVVDEAGEVRWLTSVILPLRDGESILGFAGFSIDATEQVEQERELLTRIDRLDDFASMVSHDLQSPLVAARGHLALYRERGDDGHLDSVEDSLDRIEDIAEEILALARHGDGAERHARVPLREVVTEAWESVDTREATLAVDDPPTVDGAREQLRLLLENLFRNAVGHGGDAVAVRVGSLPDGFFVEDTGAGIPPADRERAFEHGYSTGYAGSGVGLTVVRRVAEAHGWSVGIDESEEGGARFEFRIE